jgi:D-alanine-D-alanine ligase
MKVVVLAGGLSDERNVSLSSGTMVAEALRERGHQVALVDMYLGLEDYDGALETCFDAPIPKGWKKVARQAPDLEALKASRKWKSNSLFGRRVLELCQMADIVFLALHGACGEDGRIQATLSTLGIPFTGTGYVAAAIAMDKDLTKKMVIPTGVKTPAWDKVVYTQEEIPAIVERTALPVVVKPLASGSSIGVSIANSKEELEKALEECIPLGANVVLEQYVKGREIQVAYLVDRALPSIEIIPKTGFYDYENKYQPGAAEEVTPAPIPAQWEQRLAEDTDKVFHAVGMDVYARADFIVTEDGTPWFLEINTLPGMTPTSLVPQEAAAAGIGYGELCETIIRESLKIKR